MKLSKSTVPAEELAAIGRNAFPNVTEPCITCQGTGKVCPTVHGMSEQCRDCRGFGEILREMTAREEHFWILKVLGELQRDFHNFKRFG